MIIYLPAAVQQRSTLCHIGHHEVKPVLRWINATVEIELDLALMAIGTGMLYGERIPPSNWKGAWCNVGDKCKHCGRWV